MTVYDTFNPVREHEDIEIDHEASWKPALSKIGQQLTGMEAARLLD